MFSFFWEKNGTLGFVQPICSDISFSKISAICLHYNIIFFCLVQVKSEPTLKTWKAEPLPVLKTWKSSPVQYQPKNEINFDDDEDEDYDDDYEDEIDSSDLSPLGIDPPVNIFLHIF